MCNSGQCTTISFSGSWVIGFVYTVMQCENTTVCIQSTLYSGDCMLYGFLAGGGLHILITVSIEYRTSYILCRSIHKGCVLCTQ